MIDEKYLEKMVDQCLNIERMSKIADDMGPDDDRWKDVCVFSCHVLGGLAVSVSESVKESHLEIDWRGLEELHLYIIGSIGEPDFDEGRVERFMEQLPELKLRLESILAEGLPPFDLHTELRTLMGSCDSLSGFMDHFGRSFEVFSRSMEYSDLCFSEMVRMSACVRRITESGVVFEESERLIGLCEYLNHMFEDGYMEDTREFINDTVPDIRDLVKKMYGPKPSC